MIVEATCPCGKRFVLTGDPPSDRFPEHREPPQSPINTVGRPSWRNNGPRCIHSGEAFEQDTPLP